MDGSVLTMVKAAVFDDFYAAIREVESDDDRFLLLTLLEEAGEHIDELVRISAEMERFKNGREQG